MIEDRETEGEGRQLGNSRLGSLHDCGVTRFRSGSSEDLSRNRLMVSPKNSPVDGRKWLPA